MSPTASLLYLLDQLEKQKPKRPVFSTLIVLISVRPRVKELVNLPCPRGLLSSIQYGGSLQFPGLPFLGDRIPVSGWVNVKKGFHKQAIILGISIEEHQTLMKDLSPGNHFQVDLLLNDRKVSSSSWHSLVRLGRSTWLIAQLNSCLVNDSTYASDIYTLYFEVWIT